MKKRKSPIVPITILIVMASVAFGLQYAWSSSGGAGQEQPQIQATDGPAVGQARPPESKEAVSAGIKGALGGGHQPESAEAESRHGEPGGPGAPGAGPSILNPTAMTQNRKPDKPKPNPTSTSAQWYTKDSLNGSKG